LPKGEASADTTKRDTINKSRGGTKAGDEWNRDDKASEGAKLDSRPGEGAIEGSYDAAVPSNVEAAPSTM
jgi:hypothetical protein